VRGLRVRLALALVATSLATLLVAVVTLVPPLEHRLEDNRLDELRQLARTARFGVQTLPERSLLPGSPSVRRLVADLQRRTGGRVALFDETGRSLADTDPTQIAPESGGLERLEDQRLALRGDVREGVRRGEAIVISGVRRPEGDRLTLVLRKPLGDTRAAAAAVRRAVPRAAATGAAVALLLALLLSRGLLRRLRRLRDDARALGDEGLGHRVRVGPGDEVGEVAGALESMRARLIGEEAARQAFLATASHELRTPLATLQGNLELLVEDVDKAAPDPQGVRGRAVAALGITHQLVGLATDLLDLNRVDGEVPLVAEPVELVELVGVAGHEVVEALTGQGRTFAVSAVGPVHALADGPALMRILRILLDNARGHGAGAVTVEVLGDGDQAVVRVSDEGQGVAPEDRDRLFLRFERGPGAASQPGFGLGLPLARGLAERMGGTLTALDASSGACLELRLPAWSAGQAAA
jgi:signal transduction histidine kinase